jgi:hypothetical protein
MEVPLLWRADGCCATANIAIDSAINRRATQSAKPGTSEPVVRTPALANQRAAALWISSAKISTRL